MQQEWVLDVLADLKAFAQQNGMFNLAEQLDDTLMVAAGELALHGPGARGADHELEAGTIGQQASPGQQS